MRFFAIQVTIAIMCSEYQVKTTVKDISKVLGTPVAVPGGGFTWKSPVKFSVAAPVVVKQTDQLQLLESVFPVSPFPNSRLSGFENQSDGKDEGPEDDRLIQRIYEKPRWKSSFAAAPVLVPMTSFTEFAYWGEKQGSAMEFSIPNEDVFFAAGIQIKPFVPKTGKENGFSILTHTATEQMLEYHHRLLVLLKPNVALDYLEEMTPQKRFEFLIKNRYTGELNAEKIRTMAKGWEKRIPAQLHKLEREKAYRKAIKSEGVAG